MVNYNNINLLLGICIVNTCTCVFNFQFQEIYPPKLADFAYVTDGACLADEIIYTELIICKVSINATCIRL